MNAHEQSKTYLDNAATSFPKPECVTQAVLEYMTHNGAAYGRGSYADGEASVQIVSECRQNLVRLLGAESPNQIAFTFNCTDSLTLVLRGLLHDNDRVVTTTLEHNSVLRPLEQLKEEIGLLVNHIGFDAQTGLLRIDQLKSSLAESQPRLVVINHASNVTGVVQPIKEVCQLAHDAGALVLMDAAQTAGHLPIDVTRLDVDFLAAAGHKGLMGPLGTGILYVKRGCEDLLRPVRCGGTGTASESLVQPRSMPELLESGNMNMPGIAGLNAATKWLLNQDMNRLHQQLTEKTSRLNLGLSQLDRIKVHSSADSPNAGIVSFVIDDVDSREAAMILDQSFGIQCRAGFQCAPLVHRELGTESSGGSLRLSPGVFTTDQQIEAAVKAIRQLCDLM